MQSADGPVCIHESMLQERERLRAMKDLYLREAPPQKARLSNPGRNLQDSGDTS